MNRKGGYVLTARDIFLRPVRLSSDEIVATLTHPRLLLFLLLVVLVLTVSDPGRLLAVVSVWHAFLVWMVAVALQVGLCTGMALLWARAQERYNAPVVFLPLFGLLAYGVTYTSTILHVAAQSGHPPGQLAEASILLSGYLTTLLFEALYFTYVLPVLMRDISDPGDRAPARTIVVAGKRLPLERVQTLRGQEHFVLVSTDRGQRKVRARLGDLVSQTEAGDGVLAHRSYWIARHAISGFEHEGGTDVIVTRSGERLKVARTRQEEVRDWLARHLPEFSPPAPPPPAARDRGL